MITVTLIAAQSIDGFITRNDEPGTAFCSKEDQEYFFKALKSFDSLIMGRKTYELSKGAIHSSRATNRLRKIWTREPELWKANEILESVEFTADQPKAILEELENRGSRECVLLGGSELYTAFLERELVDRMFITVEPRLFGSGKKLATREISSQFALEETVQLSTNVLLLKYRKN